MGSLLAETVAAERITRLVEPVKNLFGAIFFVSVGMMIEPALLVRYAGPIVLLTVVVLAGQATFATLGVLVSGQPLRVAVQSGFSLTQVGEFAFDHSHPGHDATRDRRLPLSRHRGRIGRHDLPDALHDAGRRPRLRLSRTAPACQMAAVAGALRIGRRPRKPPQHLAAAAAAHDAARRTLSGLLHLRRSGLPALRRTVDRGADSGSDGRCGESGGDPRRAGADPACRAPAGQPLARIPTAVERQQIQPRAARLAHSHQMPALHRDSDDRRGVAVRHRFGHGLRRVAGAAHRHRLLETAPPPFVRNGGASARELRRRRHGRCRTAAE